MSKARELANLGNAYSDGALSNRNLIINGAMQVAQRGTTTSTHGSFSIDRFEVYGNKTSLVFSFAQDSDAPEGFAYSAKYTVTTAGTDTNGADRLQYRIEGYDAAQLNLGTASAKTFTLSFFVKSSIAGDYSIAFQNGDADRHYVTEYTINSTDTWEYKTITIAGDTSATWDTTNGTGLMVRWPLGNNSAYEAAANDQWANGNLFISPGATEITTTLNATFQITGVQLEVGDTATPFEHRSYGQELALCQRYYSILDFTGTHLALVIRAGEDTSGLPYNYFELPVSMRTAPSMSTSGTFLSGAQYSATPSLYESTNTAVTLRGNNGNIAAGSSQFIRGGEVLLDAEL